MYEELQKQKQEQQQELQREQLRELEKRQQIANEKRRNLAFFIIPILVSALVSLCSFSIMGLGGLVPASISIVVGIFWLFKNKQEGLNLILAGVTVWLIGASVCGLVLAFM